MHYFIYSTKDSYITEKSSGQVILYPDDVDRNYGGDEILELKKEFVNSYSTTPYNVSRMLTQFDYSNISASIVDGTITSPYKCYLRYYEVEGQSESDKTYSLSSFPIRDSWDEGVGKHFDNPKTTDGVTWESGSSGVWLGGDNLGSELITTVNDRDFENNAGSTDTSGWEKYAAGILNIDDGTNVLRLNYNDIDNKLIIGR